VGCVRLLKGFGKELLPTEADILRALPALAYVLGTYANVVCGVPDVPSGARGRESRDPWLYALSRAIVCGGSCHCELQVQAPSGGQSVDQMNAMHGGWALVDSLLDEGLLPPPLATDAAGSGCMGEGKLRSPRCGFYLCYKVLRRWSCMSYVDDEPPTGPRPARILAAARFAVGVFGRILLVGADDPELSSPGVTTAIRAMLSAGGLWGLVKVACARCVYTLAVLCPLALPPSTSFDSDCKAQRALAPCPTM
jgi:hypothetical protein